MAVQGTVTQVSICSGYVLIEVKCAYSDCLEFDRGDAVVIQKGFKVDGPFEAKPEAVLVDGVEYRRVEQTQPPVALTEVTDLRLDGTEFQFTRKF